MYVARILYPVEVLGPGKRIGIWFDGCPRRCKGCSNPELWETDDKYYISQENLLALIHQVADKNPVDGFTLTGGDPFYQYDEMIQLVRELKKIADDILVYTGYTLEEIEDKDLSGISVLVDGPYVEEENNNSPLRGSANQRIIFLDESEELRKRYEECSENRIQNFTIQGAIVSVGIHKKEFRF